MDNVKFHTLEGSLPNVKSQKPERVLAMSVGENRDSFMAFNGQMFRQIGDAGIAIIGNVLDVSLAEECSRLQVQHEFQEPFGEDVADDLNDIIRAVDGGILSTETAIELNPLVKDVTRERERLKQEKEEAAKLQQSLFADVAGAGAQSYGDGSEDDDDTDDDPKKKNEKK